MSTAGPFRAWGFAPGLLPPGPHNAITDVPGVRVGHYTRQDARPADAGSCILVLGTDLPLSSRQLGRVARRCAVGLARCGSYWGHGSGDIAIAFTTAHDIPHTGGAVLTTRAALREDALDAVFAATAEAAEESVLNALAAARPTAAPDGSVCHALCEYRDLL